MESLIRQTRVRFAGAGRENNEVSNIRDRRLPPQKAQSFKGEKKKQVSWFQRQFSRQMNKEYDPNDDGEYSTAIAAAAFAVKALEDLSIKEQKKIIEEHEKTFSKIKSRTTEDATPRVPDAGKISRRFSAEPSMKKEDIPEKAAPEILTGETKIPEIAVGPAPLIKKPATFAETASPRPDNPYAKQPPSPSTNIRRLSTPIPGVVETEADAWEKAELAKIKERYENLSMTISAWESKKKEKAKRKKDKTESELELKRAKALKHKRTETERIDQIAEGARSQAEKNRRNEEFKVKEKANRIRITGKIPGTCLCF